MGALRYVYLQIFVCILFYSYAVQLMSESFKNGLPAFSLLVHYNKEIELSYLYQTNLEILPKIHLMPPHRGSNALLIVAFVSSDRSSYSVLL